MSFKIPFLKFAKIVHLKNIHWKYDLFSKICLADFKTNQDHNQGIIQFSVISADYLK